MRPIPAFPRRVALTGVAALALSPASLAQPSWPTRPVRLVVPYAPGGPSDIVARTVQNPLSAALGQPVVVENRTGGGAVIGTESVARSDDAHSFLVADSPHTIIPAVQPRVPYDAAADFAPVGLLGAVTMVLMVRAGHPATDFASFLAGALARPESVTFGSSGVGSLTHLLPEWLGQLTGARFTVVPYRGSGPALLDVAAGQIDAIFSSTLSASGQLRDGAVRALAVAAPERLATLPQVPSFRENRVDLVCSNWWGVLAPSRMAPPILARMAAALETSLIDAAVRERLDTLGVERRPTGPAPLATLLETEFRNWAQVARAAGVRAP